MAKLPGETTEEKMRLNVRRQGNCLRWTGCHSPTGYGYLRNPNTGRTGNVHRMAYEAFVGPIPEGLEIDHLCNVRDCINTDHMELVTHRENLIRRFSRTESAA